MVNNPNGIGGFSPGVSGNPRGRPKGAQEIQNRALALCTEALDTLAEIMRGRADKSIVSSQIAACSLILDRGCGRAGQSLALQIDLNKRIADMSDQELQQMADLYRNRYEKVIEHDPDEKA
jgi:hypothetical protein